MKDDDIIQQTLRGDQNAFAALIAKYQNPLFDLAFRILGNRSEAEDVLQQAFLQAYQHLSEFKRQARFSTWLYSIVLNRVRNELRHNKIIKWRSLDGFSAPHDEEDTPAEMPEKGPSVSILLEQKMDLEAVQKAVKHLQPLYQSIFILHYFQDLSLEEIAQRLNRPVGTIKVYLHRARQVLYKLIPGSGNPERTPACAAA